MRIHRSTGRSVALISLLGLGGCGGGENPSSLLRPPAAINVSAAITDGRISVSPRAFGAGPIVLVVSNQTDEAQAVTFETERVAPSTGSGLSQTTSPINPAGTALIEVDVRRGRYRLSTDASEIRPTAVRVGPARRSAQDELLTP